VDAGSEMKVIALAELIDCVELSVMLVGGFSVQLKNNNVRTQISSTLIIFTILNLQ
jgi:hypothetical protein